MIELPLENDQLPLVRILVAARFNGGAGPWIPLPMAGGSRSGFELLRLTRPALPAVGECFLRYRFGRIDGRIVGLSPDAVAAVRSGSALADIPDAVQLWDLTHREVRVQMAPYPASGEATAWRTVWWGQCEYATDEEWPGASIPAGDRTYTCLDAFWRTKRWRMDRHSAYVDSVHYNGIDNGVRAGFIEGVFQNGMVGHPGYNVGSDGLTIGNRSSATYTPFPDSDGAYFSHTWQGSDGAIVWNDKQAVEHALRIDRAEGEPQWSLFGSTELFTVGASPWAISESARAWDVVALICARERGRGLVFAGWADDLAAPDGPLVPRLTVRPQTKEDITYITNPQAGTTATLPGAHTAGTAIDVDLEGDHRALASGFTRSDRGLAQYGSVETVGERIQVLITASLFDSGVGPYASWERRYGSAVITAFKATAPENRIEERWRLVYQATGLPRTWRGHASDHNGGTAVGWRRADYRCTDAGKIQVSEANAPFPITSPLEVRLLPDLPLLEGYDYIGLTPARTAADPNAGIPARRDPFVLLRTAANRYVRGEDVGVALRIQRDQVLIYRQADAGAGTRFISDTTIDDLGAVYDDSQLGITIALELPHRLRLRSYRAGETAASTRDTKRIEIPDAHLWLAHPGAIWDLDGPNSDDDGAPGQRFAVLGLATLPGILRSDVARVAVLHALACAWYLTDHRPCTWSLRACGLLGSFADADGAAIPYPALGELVEKMHANGQTINLNTPITGIQYDHQTGITTWSTDWADLDVSRA